MTSSAPRAALAKGSARRGGRSRASLYAMQIAAMAAGVTTAACGGTTQNTAGEDASGGGIADATPDVIQADGTVVLEGSDSGHETSDATADAIADATGDATDACNDPCGCPCAPPYGCVFPNACDKTVRV